MMRKFLSVTVALMAGFAMASLSSPPIRSKRPSCRATAGLYDAGIQRVPSRKRRKGSAAKIKLLDDFVSKYPNSTLLQYVYQLYYQAYAQQKNYPKGIEYADKLVALGDKADIGARLQAIQARVQAFSASTFDREGGRCQRPAHEGARCGAAWARNCSGNCRSPRTRQR